jgi:hypothetical protein
MKKNRIKEKFLDELRRIPIVQVACEKLEVSRNSVYRWKKTDEEFSKEMDQALADGEAYINDMTESQLLSLIRDKSWPAMSFWLRHRNPKFRDRVEVTTKVENDGKLSAEQEATVREALKLVSLGSSYKTKEHE